MTDKFIYTNEDILAMLDHVLASRERSWWDEFYTNRAKPCPFFVDSPDESLAEWVEGGLIHRGKALDLGCGNGRNAIFLARRGFDVVGVDYAETAIAWAGERVKVQGITVELKCQSVFELECEPDSCDFIYDSGCFHHMAPHRRQSYVELVAKALKPGGWFGLTCFRPEGGSGFSDIEVYERRSMGGGLGYSEKRLREIWSRELEIRVLRQMRKPKAGDGLFGEDFLWVMLGQK